MLSRVADSLYWMSRYLERAEHTARVLNVNLHGLLDQKADVGAQRWARALHSLHVDVASEPALVPLEIAQALTYDPEMPGSIVSCIASARHNAREVREEISTEMWEQINRLALHVRTMDRNGVRQGRAHAFFQDVKEGSHLFQGITDATLSHDDGWHFIQLGRYIERVQATVSLLDAHIEADAPEADSEARHNEWVDLLKSCTAFEAYCRSHSVHVEPDQAVEFLLLAPHFPHAVRFGVRKIQGSLEALAETTPQLKQGAATRTVGKLASSLRFDAIDEILSGDVHGYLSGIRAQCSTVHRALYDACVSYPIESALTVQSSSQ